MIQVDWPDDASPYEIAAAVLENMRALGDRALAAESRLAEVEKERDRLREALRLAGNRLLRLAVELPHDTGIRADASEWSDEAEASAALSKEKA